MLLICADAQDSLFYQWVQEAPLGKRIFYFVRTLGDPPPPRVRPLLDSYTAPDLYFPFSPSSFPSSSNARSSTETSFNTYSDYQTIRPLRPRNSLSLRKQKEKARLNLVCKSHFVITRDKN